MLQQVHQPLGLQAAAHAGAQLGRLEGLHQIIAGSHFQPAHFFVGAPRAGEEDDGNVRGSRIPLNLSADVKPVGAGKINVEQDQVGPIRQRHPGGLVAVETGDELQRFTGQPRLHKLVNVRRVVNDEDSLAGHFAPSLRRSRRSAG